MPSYTSYTYHIQVDGTWYKLLYKYFHKQTNIKIEFHLRHHHLINNRVIKLKPHDNLKHDEDQKQIKPHDR